MLSVCGWLYLPVLSKVVKKARLKVQLPADAGCPTSPSFSARCGIPRVFDRSPSRTSKLRICKDKASESQVSRKTSSMPGRPGTFRVQADLVMNSPASAAPARQRISSAFHWQAIAASTRLGEPLDRFYHRSDRSRHMGKVDAADFVAWLMVVGVKPKTGNGLGNDSPPGKTVVI